ncbi:MAG: hypothetical protein ACM3PP_09435 [Candidatus Saccharibacteria bacterium]
MGSTVLVFVSILSLLAVIVSWFYLGARDADVKRMLHPLILITISIVVPGATLAAIGTWSSIVVPWYVYLLVVILIVGFDYLGLKRVSFCNNCARTIIRTSEYGPDRCPRCGRKL